MAQLRRRPSQLQPVPGAPGQLPELRSSPTTDRLHTIGIQVGRQVCFAIPDEPRPPAKRRPLAERSPLAQGADGTTEQIGGLVFVMYVYASTSPSSSMRSIPLGKAQTHLQRDWPDNTYNSQIKIMGGETDEQTTYPFTYNNYNLLLIYIGRLGEATPTGKVPATGFDARAQRWVSATTPSRSNLSLQSSPTQKTEQLWCQLPPS